MGRGAWALWWQDEATSALSPHWRRRDSVAQHCVQILRRPELGSLAPEPGLTHFGPTVRAVPYRVEPLHHGADRHGPPQSRLPSASCAY